jgi:hypothetical protein
MTEHDPAPGAFYSEPGRMTSVGSHASQIDKLPHDVGALAAVIQGLLIHEHMAQAYGVTLTEDDRSSVHVRPADQLLELIVARDDRPLDAPRPPATRLPGNCRHFSVLMVAMLRAQGTPARARCGFGAYFIEGAFEDHWVCEYWSREQERWVLVDAQIDAGQRAYFPIDFDVTDVPRDRFVIAGDAWRRYRAGDADPDRFGLSVVKEFGAWWIAGNLMRDVAALRNIELLPWDVWGDMPGPQAPITEMQRAHFDDLAPLTQAPDATFAELQQRYDADDRIRVPPKVFNALRGYAEAI